MAFRWKTTELNPTFVDPQGVQAYQQQQAMGNSARALNAANAMSGYQPNVQPNYRGVAPSQTTQMVNAQLAQQNYNQFMQDDASLQGKRQQLEQLKMQLAEIDKQIASVEAGGADEEKAIAAKLAEIGDTSLYQGILAREQNQAAQQKSSSTGINNLLFEADKLSWGLNSKSDEERTIARNEIRVNLEKAKYMADQTGTPLPDKYYQLKARLEQGTEPNGEATAEVNAETLLQKENTLSQLDRTGQLSDNDLKPFYEYLADKGNRNKQEYKKVEEIVKKFKNRTVEAKATAYKRKKDAKTIVDTLRDLSLDEQLRRWSNMAPSKQQLVRDHGYIMDPKLGITSKDGI